MVESTARPAARWGILGTGGIARQFTQDLLLAGHTVTAVGSRTRENAERFAALFELPTAHASYESLVADPSVDLIYVATPHPFHYPNATLALEAGKHVLVEKPFTLNATQAQHLVAHAADKGLLVLEAMWTRWLPHMVRLREIVAAGTIGELRSMSADHTQRLPDDPGHRLNALELGGGALLDLGVYPVSFASDLFGPPQSIQAVATFKETGADAQVATMFRYPGGQIATTYSASTTRGPNVAVILGSRAASRSTASGTRQPACASTTRTARWSRRPVRPSRAGACSSRRQRRNDWSARAASRATSSRRRRRSPSWRRWTRSETRSACATRASDRTRQKGRHLAAPSHSRRSRTGRRSVAAYPAERARVRTNKAASTVPHPVASL